MFLINIHINITFLMFFFFLNDTYISILNFFTIWAMFIKCCIFLRNLY